MTIPPEDSGLPEVDALAAELDVWDSRVASSEPHSLVDLVNRVLDKGVVLTGEVTISVAGIDLVYLGLNAILTSVSTANQRVLRDGAPLLEGLPDAQEMDGE